MSDFDRLDLSEPFLRHLKNLVDGNGVDGSDLKEISSECYDFRVYLDASWEFYGECKEREITGGEKAEIHFGDDLQEFQNHTQDCLRDARHSESLHEILLSKFRSDPQSGVTAADNSVKYYDFKPFSAFQKCGVCLGGGKVRCGRCGGRGKVRCTNCGGRGRKSCPNCGGSGGQNRPYTQYRSDGSASTAYRYEACSVCAGSGTQVCSACYGSGHRSCSACFGDGYIKCDRCGGQGYFMYIRNISAHARAKVGVQVRSAVYAQELQKFLCNQSCESLSQNIPFRLKEEQGGDGEHDFIYVGSHTITQLRFELLGKRYEAAGFGDPLLAFIRPAIFDDLFADELAMLNDMGSDGKISGTEAFKFFNRYAAQPALDASLKKLAKQGGEPKDAVADACDGYISQQAAKQLGDALKGCLNKISPVYSPVVWFGLGSLFWLFALIFTAGFFGENFTERYLLTPICGAAFLAICLVASWCVLTPLSALVTMFRRRKVPAEYRTGMQNQKAFVKFRKILIACCLLGAFYGIAASLGYAPRLYEFDARFDLARNLGLKRGEQTDANSSTNGDRNGSGAEISAQSGAPQIGPSQKEKILYIQKSIGVKQDGIFGARTLKKAREVLDQNLSSVDEIYEALKSKERAMINLRPDDKSAP